MSTIEKVARAMCAASFKRQFPDASAEEVAHYCDSGTHATWTLWREEAIAAIKATEPVIAEAYRTGYRNRERWAPGTYDTHYASTRIAQIIGTERT